jgi:hypothetical protein
MSGLLIILYVWNFLRTILIIVLVYYVFKIIGKIVFASVLNQAKTNIRQNQQQANRKKEGEVTIINNENSSSKDNHNEGEYVDFEEVD